MKASLPSSENEMSDWDSAVDELTAGSPKLWEMVNGTQVLLRHVLDTPLRLCLLWSPGPHCRRSVAFREDQVPSCFGDWESGFETFPPFLRTVLTSQVLQVDSELPFPPNANAVIGQGIQPGSGTHRLQRFPFRFLR